ncbi:hypothetical protein E5F05_19860 [Deinococcus metallilatus]|uniref:Uncharacterized protein n=1 Tax=Deinococcus metallilatus TaxID=1211322 RepID=A0AAJ5F5T1_9DEIO|nr:hypothetical protein [Deinococcus metallilatus]MBB5296320.1 hypothetical protein [Deinococcus metallilatus]QBY09998.1 hypothetical protein E5F05_19860 [Deinococcus metallilatus]RXJ08722.1 hypothetical protein ERJ73_18700 [Deinococcus metallilatus]TLK25196.1 hypothetical protein FCS05_13615 [Deinococcus metallilatus]GMA14768.1 hypothetical protein GCM10025871_10990 [Deinococcus metallilatus]
MPEEEKKVGRAAPKGTSDGRAIYDALTAMEGPFEREQPAMQERPELLDVPDKDSADSPASQDAQALADAYRDSAAEMMADPLFDLDTGHGLSSLEMNQEDW